MYRRSAKQHLALLWTATWLLPAVVQIVLSFWFSGTAAWDAPHALFWIVVIAASCCVVTSALLIRRSFQTLEAELGGLGLFLLAVSILPLVHGVTTPGALSYPMDD